VFAREQQQTTAATIGQIVGDGSMTPRLADRRLRDSLLTDADRSRMITRREFPMLAPTSVVMAPSRETLSDTAAQVLAEFAPTLFAVECGAQGDCFFLSVDFLVKYAGLEQFVTWNGALFPASNARVIFADMLHRAVEQLNSGNDIGNDGLALMAVVKGIAKELDGYYPQIMSGGSSVGNRPVLRAQYLLDYCHYYANKLDGGGANEQIALGILQRLTAMLSRTTNADYVVRLFEDATYMSWAHGPRNLNNDLNAAVFDRVAEEFNTTTQYCRRVLAHVLRLVSELVVLNSEQYSEWFARGEGSMVQTTSAATQYQYIRPEMYLGTDGTLFVLMSHPLFTQMGLAVATITEGASMVSVDQYYPVYPLATWSAEDGMHAAPFLNNGSLAFLYGGQGHWRATAYHDATMHHKLQVWFDCAKFPRAFYDSLMMKSTNDIVEHQRARAAPGGAQYDSASIVNMYLFLTHLRSPERACNMPGSEVVDMLLSQ
jgi:hypothetical protein